MSLTKQQFIELIQKHQQNMLSDEEHLRLNQLLENDAEKRKFFEEMTKPSKITSNVDHAFEKLKSQMADSSPHTKGKVLRIPIWKYAAAVLIVCGLFATAFIVYQRKTAPLIYQTAMGNRATYTLPDGTKVWLNGGSKITIANNFGNRDRRVKLDGEAYFDVSHNANKPFYVSADQLEIKVLGTAFNIRAYHDETLRQTTLMRGKVQLSVKNKSMGKQQAYTMLPGDQISLNNNEQLPNSSESGKIEIKKEIIKENEVLENQAGWKDNVLVFDNDPMSLVQSKLEKWYGVNIEIKDNELLKKHFTGVFHESSIEEVLKLLIETGGIKKISNANKTIIIE